MNYREELNLGINETWQALTRVGWLAAARSVEAAAETAETSGSLSDLMAAADHAAWHLQQLDNAALRAASQYDKDCY